MPASERYRLVDMLGRGAMGEVWRAEDTALRREVAVKLLLEQPAVAEATERFRREAQTAARLNHPNVVAVYDFDEEDGRLYLVMELVSGSSLREETAARGSLGIAEACRIAGQAATGLAAAHELGVVHRDIKPGNLLLSADGVVKVADFGIARAAMEVASSLTATGSMLGTTAYLAPERGTGSLAEPPSDVYALGCVLYEMLCGQPPFAGDPAAVVYQHVNAAPHSPADLRPEQPDGLADFILLMLAKDPAQRPTAAQAADFLSGISAETDRATDRTSRTMAAADAPAESTLTLQPAHGHRRSRRSALVPVIAATVAVFLIACVVGYQLNSGPGKGDAQPPAPSKSTSPEPSRSPAHHNSKAPATPPPTRDRPAPSKTADQLDDQTPTATEQERKRRKEAAQKAIDDARKAAEERLKRREEAAKR